MKLLLGLLFSGKLGKVLLTGGTMLLSMVTYAFIFGWRYAVGFVLLIFVHEMGHYLAAKQRGLNVGAPTFIPFVGAWIQLKEQPHDAETEAYVGFAGPLLGSVAALACYVVFRHTDDRLFLALASSGVFLNLFNLIPLSPFDGGRITSVITPRVWLVGVPILVMLFLYRPSPILVMVAIMAAPQVMAAWRYDAAAPENAAYYGVSLEHKLTYGCFYLGLVAFLALMSFDLHQLMGGIR